MFSLRVSELTPELLAKAGYWKIYELNAGGMPYWADTRRAERLHIAKVNSGDICLLGHIGDAGYYGNNLCHPVTFTPDGTEVRLECPRMPDEECVEPLSEDAIFADYDADDHGWNFYNVGYRRIFCTAAPTPEHYPRRTCDGVWVWSMRGNEATARALVHAPRT